MHESLSHLTQDQVQDVMERYYNGEKVTDILEEYQIKVQPAKLFELFPRTSTDSACLYCQRNLFLVPRSKTAANYNKGRYDKKCIECNHSDTERNCRCSNCQRKKKEELRKEREEHERIEAERQAKAHKIILSKLLNINEVRPKRRLAELSDVEKIVLGSFLHFYGQENMELIGPLSSQAIPLAPSEAFSKEFRDFILNQGLITYYEGELHGYYLEPGDDVSFNWQEVVFQLNIEDDSMPEDILSHTLRFPDSSSFDHKTLSQLWSKIAIKEAVQYLEHSIEKAFHINYNAGDKTHGIIQQVLENYSVGQCYKMIYSAVNNGLRYQAESRINTRHAANAVVTNLFSFYKKAIERNYSIDNYTRLRDLPQSAISRFLFENVLDIGEAGFKETPGLTGEKKPEEGFLSLHEIHKRSIEEVENKDKFSGYVSLKETEKTNSLEFEPVTFSSNSYIKGHRPGFGFSDFPDDEAPF